MKGSSSLQAGSYSTGQETPCLLSNLKILHYERNALMDPILICMYPVHTSRPVVSHQFLVMEAKVKSRTVHMRFLVDEMTLGQIFIFSFVIDHCVFIFIH